MIALALAVSGCSKENAQEKASRNMPPASEQAAKKIDEFGKKPINAAKKTQLLGEERTRNIDDALENMDKH